MRKIEKEYLKDALCQMGVIMRGYASMLVKASEIYDEKEIDDLKKAPLADIVFFGDNDRYKLIEWMDENPDFSASQYVFHRSIGVRAVRILDDAEYLSDSVVEVLFEKATELCSIDQTTREDDDDTILQFAVLRVKYGTLQNFYKLIARAIDVNAIKGV